MSIVQLHATCKYRCTYKCRRCEAVAVGGTVRVSFVGETPRELEQFLAALPPNASAMPAAWASYHDGFECPICGDHEHVEEETTKKPPGPRHRPKS